MIFHFAAKMFMMSAEAGLRAVMKLSQFAVNGWMTFGG